MMITALVVAMLVGPSPPRSAEVVPPGRVRIEAFQEGHGVAWFLRLETGGKLTVQVGLKEISRKLDDAAMARLAEVVRKEAIFELDDNYGEALIDLPWRTVKVWQGERVKTMTLYSGLRAEVRQDEVKRALRFWLAIRGLFEAERAVDTRTEDRQFVEN
jgi:hypothetical protein